MTYEDLITIVQSSAKEDWLHDVDWEEVWTHKKNQVLRCRVTGTATLMIYPPAITR